MTTSAPTVAAAIPTDPRVAGARTGGAGSAPLRVLFIEHSIGVSGSTVSLCTLLSHLPRERYEPCVVFSRAAQRDYLRRSGAPAADATVMLWRNGLKSTRFGRAVYEMALRLRPPIRRLVTGVLSLLDIAVVIAPSVVRLYRLARSRQIMLVHHNNGVEPRSVLLARLLGVPLVVYQRGADWHSRSVRALASMVTLFVANSEATRQDLLQLGVDPGRVRVIYPPVDLGRFDPGVDVTRQRAELGIAPGDLCFGILGTLLRWKGQHVFLRAARIVLEEMPRARALIVGEAPDGSRTYRDELLQLAREAGIADRVVFTGFREDISEIIQVLQVVVHASVTPEPFGRVIVEAMAMRKPVVATMAGGPLEIIDDGFTGYLVPADEPEPMARRIIQLLTDPALAARIGHQARRTVETRFSARAHAGLVEQVYVEALARGARTPKVSEGEP